MLSFASDYIAGAHPQILKRLTETNLENLPGYGTDPYTMSAAAKIKQFCGTDNIEVYFLVGGTQTNQIIIDTMLAPYEGVISATSGHINVHEAGAVEFTGHKVIELPAENGKLSAKAVNSYCEDFFSDENCEHMVNPGMVYISFPSEYGTIYSRSELYEISAVCRKYNLLLFMDGARLAYGLASYSNDVSIKDIVNVCDAFYFGGTKVGALCGEAVVFRKDKAPKHFITQIKQHGALLAKGRLTGVSFDTLFTDDLYMEIGRYAIKKAEDLKEIFKSKGYRFFIDSPTNQQFIIISNDKLKEIEKKVVFSFWEKYDKESSVVRFATSWSTTDEDLDMLKKII